MLFNTLDFLIFFPIVISFVVLIKNRKSQHIFIILASFFFLYYTNNYLIVLLLFTTLFHFYLGREIVKSTTKKRKKSLFVLAVGGSLGLLGFFKYTDFAIAQFNVLGNHFDFGSQISLLNLILPIGISFYTFHSLSYIIDLYRGNLQPCNSLREYAFFVVFFPTLVAGPILRASQFLPQLREKIMQSDTTHRLRQILITNPNLKFGITLMTLGFFKKMFFSDNIAPFVNEIFLNPIGLESYSIILGIIAFAIQIYCDFSGYSDIAIGIAAILGFKIPLNFNKPFFASSPSDYWTRWHISLSTWVRDYLYFPLVFKNRKSDLRIISSLLISMILIGLWHGSAWNFVIWGGLHGIYLSFYTIIRKRFSFLESHQIFKKNVSKFFSIIVTQYFVTFTFIAFRVRDLDHMFYSMKKYIFLDFSTVQTIEIIKSNEFAMILILLFISLHIISYKQGNLAEKISKINSGYWMLFLTTIFLLVALFYVGTAQQFIYFKF